MLSVYMDVIPRIQHLGGIALDLLFPKTCVGCGREGNLICTDCRATFKYVSRPVCPKCGLPEINGIICPDCVFQNRAIDGIRSVLQFEGVIRKAIHEFKYRNIRILATVLAKLMVDYMIQNQLPADLLIPVPLHNKRLRERGYNQSELLAREISSLIFIPTDTAILFRRKFTAAQAKTTSVEQRKINVAGAFVCRKPVTDSKILLIDDVTTSTTTLEACAVALKASGAESVWGFTLAREL